MSLYYFTYDIGMSRFSKHNTYLKLKLQIILIYLYMYMYMNHILIWMVNWPVDRKSCFENLNICL